MTERSASIPRVTIGLPVYNGERTLRTALTSLLGQTYDDFVLIISDNASTDGTEFLCREFAARDDRIHYIRHSANMGAQWSFDFVMRQATTEYFMWAACDDSWDANFIACMVNSLDSDPASVGAMCPFFLVDDDRNALSELMEYHQLESPSRLRRTLALSCFRTGCVQIYGLYRSRVLQNFVVRSCPWAPGYSIFSEYGMLLYISASGTTRTVMSTRFYHRTHAGQEGMVRVPYVPYCLIRIHLIYGLPAAVWKASRSPLLALAVFGATAVYSFGSIFWQAVRRTFKLPERHRLVLPVPESPTGDRP